MGPALQWPVKINAIANEFASKKQKGFLEKEEAGAMPAAIKLFSD